MPVTSGLVAALAGAVFAYALYSFLNPMKDAREPPYISSSIPLIGHLLGMAIQGADYFRKLDEQYHQSIYTLPMLTGRMYMICDPSWVNPVYRAQKTLSFHHLVARAMRYIFGMDETAMKIIDHNKDGEDGTRSGLLLEGHDMMGAALAPSPDMDATTEAVINEEAKRVNRLAREGATHEIKLWSWIRDNFSMASVDALYGADNPYQLHKGLLDDFFLWDKTSMYFMLVPWPSVLIAGAYRARQRVFDAWTEWVKNERYKKSSVFIQKRADFNLNSFGFSAEMYAHGEASMNFGALSNTIPSGFWLLSYIFSDAQLLTEVREEIDKCISQAGSNKRTINLALLKTRCPVFLSSFREVLRIVAGINNARYVLRDTTITNSQTGESYLLKKDSMIQIATNVIHAQTSIWGEDANDFNPRRFLPSYAGPDAKPADPAAPFKDQNGKTHTGALRTFGGGNSICLGRHFAQSEIMALAAIFVAGFEITDRGEESGLTMPELPAYKVPMGGVLHPTRDPEVDVRRRRGYEKVEWSFEL